MYIPKHFLNTDREDIVAFMQRYSFATIVTTENNIPEATHLPFLIQKCNDRIVLSSHFAKANPQASTIFGKEVLVIFMEPHAYISPKFYEKEQNVPTWDYLAVQAYGKATHIETEASKLDLLEKMILTYEADYLKQWKGRSIEYKLKMLKGIVAFDIEVTDLQGAKKLSQNKTSTEQQNIIESFSRNGDPNEVQIAEYIKLNPK